MHNNLIGDLRKESAVTGRGLCQTVVMGVLVSCTALADPVDLYRLYSNGATDHFYTTSLDEALRAASQYGYVYEGIAGKCMSTHEPGMVPLYRLYSYPNRDHLYTTSWQERDI
ncbi:hypothetical protein, partial [Archangium sp.]|uniref:hypothetical protein n=1 Tax=Archangium sp. TaxID=1872627 RepID=UPI002D636C05|nr:hypothetical protein [Archangium sp.]